MEDKILSISEFYGLSESPDGERELKPGEAAVMNNFSVTRDGNLRKRPGSRRLLWLTQGSPVQGIWCGSLSGRERIIAACGGRLWEAEQGEGGWTKRELGAVSTINQIQFIEFNEKLWLLNGEKYLCYDGESLFEPAGYVPIVMISVPPAGGGEKLEGLNLLTARRRVWLSPDGKSNKFVLPEQNISALHYVKSLKTGEILPASAYTAALNEGSISFSETPAADVNSLEICYSMPSDGREAVNKMRWAEMYNGAQDSRLFFCGDGSNKLIYSGLDYEGRARADYFPEHNFLHIGGENSPVTGLLRHHTVLLCFKTDSAWSIKSGAAELPESGGTTGFYCSPMHRSIGCSAPGQTALINNNPRTLWGRELYSWQGSGIYAASGFEEREARCISERIYRSLGAMDFLSCRCFDDRLRQEYYIFDKSGCLVENYARDAWYRYTDLDISAMANSPQGLLFGSRDGALSLMGEKLKSDSGAPIHCRWESGYMAFGARHLRKHSANLWIGIKNEANGELKVSVSTEKQGSCGEKLIRCGLSSFSEADFGRWSFSVSRSPRMKRLRIKAKKFVFYKLILSSDSAVSSVTVPAADIRVRCSGAAK